MPYVMFVLNENASRKEEGSNKQEKALQAVRKLIEALNCTKPPNHTY